MAKKGKALSDSFDQQLVQTLNHFRDAAWLGENSPLAAPYFLGEHLSKRDREASDNATERGLALRKLLRQTTALLPERDEKNRECRHLLELRYFENNSITWILSELSIPRASLYRYLDAAVQRLKTALLEKINPALRLETPVKSRQIYGRDVLIKGCVSALQQGKMVGITGPGGIGKTMLVAHITANLNDQPTFWFTFRIGLNDHLNTLFFALGYFLHLQGASNLWLQLVADQGQVDMTVAPALLRQDMEALGKSPPILYFDEVDLLRSDESENHAQLINFLEGMRGLAPTVLIGQYLVIETDVSYDLTGLSQEAIVDMLAQDEITLSDRSLSQLKHYTNGNARLLELFISLHRVGDSIEKVLSDLSDVPSVEALLNRIWQRLDKPQKELLIYLSIYQRPAPSDIWSTSKQIAALNQLTERRLIQTDEHGGIMLLPAFKQTIYNDLSPEKRSRLHLDAAAVLAERGEYTLAASHCLAGQRPAWAVQLWYPNRVMEINQGQASIALDLFDQILRSQLRSPNRELLVLARNELRKLRGAYSLIREDLRSTIWKTRTLKARAKRLEGDIEELSDRLGPARQAYQDGIDLINKELGQFDKEILENEIILFRRDIAWVHRREKNMNEAWWETQLARYELEQLQGNIQRDLGQSAEAKTHYLSALTLAQELSHREGEAKTRNVLAALLARQGEFEDAIAHWEVAFQYYKRIGKQSGLASVRSNQANCANLADRSEEAISLAEEALELFTRLGQQPYGMAVCTQVLAEAYLAIEDYEQAEQYAYQVTQMEETSTMSDGLRTFGEAKLAQGEIQMAEAYIQQAVQIAQESQEKFLEAYALRALGQVYLAKQKIDEASNVLEQALQIFKGYEADKEVKKTIALLS